jgi:hypothetical protein
MPLVNSLNAAIPEIQLPLSLLPFFDSGPAKHAIFTGDSRKIEVLQKPPYFDFRGRIFLCQYNYRQILCFETGSFYR